MSSLFINRQLNYDEAIRRLHHWSENTDLAQAKGAIRTLAQMLEKNRDNLFFEPSS